jgi:hypothetical protein
MKESTLIPPHKRTELNHTQVGREAVRVIDTLDALNEANQGVIKECLKYLRLNGHKNAETMSERLLKLVDDFDFWNP